MSNLHCFTKDSVTKEPTKKGPLSGLTFAVKDLVSIKGHISSYGHPRWRVTHQPADKDSSVITTLLDNGAKLVGTTKMDQLAYSIIGNIGEDEAPLNTKYPERFCGGSSSGSASAVAGELVDFAIGSDTGGSIRIPAAACGIYGIRTTFGMVPKDGVIDFAKSADVLGFFARTPETLRKVTALFTEPERQFTFKKIILPKNLANYTDIDVDLFAKEANNIARKGNLELVEKDVSDFVSPKVKDLFARNQSRQIWEEHRVWAEQNMQYLAEEVQERLAYCKKVSAYERSILEEDKELYKQYCQKMDDFIDIDSVLCLPILATSGPNLDMSDETSAAFRGNTFINIGPSSITGLPELSAPISGGSSNIGLMGPKFSDCALIDLVN